MLVLLISVMLGSETNHINSKNILVISITDHKLSMPTIHYATLTGKLLQFGPRIRLLLFSEARLGVLQGNLYFPEKHLDRNMAHEHRDWYSKRHTNPA